MHLRQALRPRLLPDERLVAWGSVRRVPRQRAALLAVAMTFPPVGMLLAPFILGSKPMRFLILTDSRLLVLKTRPSRHERREGGWVVAEANIASVRVLPLAKSGPFEVALDDEDPPQRLEVLSRTRPAKRLVQAMHELARLETETD